MEQNSFSSYVSSVQSCGAACRLAEGGLEGLGEVGESQQRREAAAEKERGGWRTLAFLALQHNCSGHSPLKGNLQDTAVFEEWRKVHFRHGHVFPSGSWTGSS